MDKTLMEVKIVMLYERSQMKAHKSRFHLYKL